MDSPVTETSPLAAFPNEHPTPTIQKPNSFRTSRMILIGGIVLVLVLVGGLGGMLFLNQQKKSAQKIAQNTPSPTITQPTPQVALANMKSYVNPSYSYEIKYAQNTTSTETNTPQYGYTEFQNGCFKVYAVPHGTEDTLIEKENDIPWKQFDALKNLRVGEKRNCSVLTFTFGADNKAIVNKNYYTRKTSKQIGGMEWYAFEVDNTLNPQSTHTVYFVEENNYTYVIDTLSGGSCPASESEDMLTTFSFIH
jgi:hypothetical protein